MPSLHWHCCHPQAGIVALVTITSSSLMRRHPCRHCDGIVALVAMALLPLMRRCLCRCCNCNCCPHDNDAIAIVNGQASLPLLRWYCPPHNNGVDALDLRWRCCPLCNGIVAILKLVLLPLLQWRHCHHQCAGILAVIVMALLSLLQWCCCH